MASGHTRGLLLVGIQSVEQPGILTKAFYLFTSLQHEAVIVFFVVSGFLVGGSILQALSAGSFSIRHYIVKRFTRIYIVLVPAILLAAALTALGVHFLGDTRFYGQLPLIPSGFNTTWSWPQIPCHVAALQGLFCQAFSFNPPLWSLGFEWTLYLLAPVLLGIFYLPGNRLFVVALLAIAICTLLTLKPLYVWAEWPFYWFLGVAAARVYAFRPTPALAGVVALALCAVAFPLSRLDLIPLRATDVWIALFLAIAFTSKAVLEIAIVPTVIKRGADFSYSLYAIHLPLAIFIAALLETAGTPKQLAQPSAVTIFAFATVMTVVVILSHAFARFTERRTSELRHWCNRFIAGPVFVARSPSRLSPTSQDMKEPSHKQNPDEGVAS